MSTPHHVLAPPVTLPEWVLRIVPHSHHGESISTGRLECRSATDPLAGTVLLSFRLRDAASLDAAAFEEACFDIYRRMLDDLGNRAEHELSAVRLWNFIPGILEPLGDHEHRYMAFNAGRYRALRAWHGDAALPDQVATASGVGHRGQHLDIHCLASIRQGRAVENPRQRPAYRYSKKYGQLPPCFARATLWPAPGEGLHLLVGGTASVRGEESLHRDDLRRQLDETFYNLAAVVRAAEGTPCAHLQPEEVRNLMRRYGDLRVYVVDPGMEADIAERLRRFVDPGARVEYLRADLCRPDLLVEIEGVVRLQSGG
ncbi:MAG: hypothetical protein AAFX50_02700 [Acidobacteriota bacterium]